MQSNLAYEFEEERREEIINGKVVMMASPTLNHNFVAGNIYALFFNYLDKRPCTPFSDNTKVILSETERYIPDMMVVCDPNKFGKNCINGAPDLVVEVLSPKTARNDRGFKKDAYERHGVREYWIVSPAERTIEQYVLRDGRFVLHNVYAQFPQFMLDDMTEEERAAVVTEFQSVLFDDLTIRLEDVFKRVT
ncbi:MAG: Uma2 family endonuclease [Oscillibacter sp.]|nr:Uma2 family endonuclease [Oscillibacter sp.]